MREIPSIDHLLQRPGIRTLAGEYGRPVIVGALRTAAEALRARIGPDQPPPSDVADWLEAEARSILAVLHAPSLRAVINGTGVILHTNLGRAPLGPAVLERISLLGGYTNLEFDLDAGARGRRDVHAERLLRLLTGAAAAVVVNNNAAATLVTLAALASGREVLISRGELVEIGGGFRVPEVMSQSGAILREVGTTNRTRVSDYGAAISDRTAAILRVHPSNFRIEGFTERPRLEDLVALARKFSLTLIEDVGSGWLGEGSPPAYLRDEPSVRSSVAAGADAVLFSGDKLLGGPQAGIVAGSEPAVGAIRRHPLMRALRVDKLTYAGLEATLQEYAAGRAGRGVLTASMMAMAAADIGARAESIGRSLGGDLSWELVDGNSTIGGGSAPGSQLPTRLLALTHARLSPSELESSLRRTDPPVITRIVENRVVIDMRTVLPHQEQILVRLLDGLARLSAPE